jgi:hypothetical protein
MPLLNSFWAKATELESKVTINEAAIGLMTKRDKNLMHDPQIKEKEITTRKVILRGSSKRYKSFLANGESTSGQPFNDALHFHS